MKAEASSDPRIVDKLGTMSEAALLHKTAFMLLRRIQIISMLVVPISGIVRFPILIIWALFQVEHLFQRPKFNHSPTPSLNPPKSPSPRKLPDMLRYP